MTLDLMLAGMHQQEYADIGNGLWVYKSFGNNAVLMREEGVKAICTLENGEIVGQRLQREIPFAPCPEPIDSTPQMRTKLWAKHRIDRCMMSGYFTFTNPAGDHLFFLISVMITAGIIQRTRNSPNTFTVAENCPGLVWGRSNIVTWPSTRTVPMGLFQLKSWQWFDPDDESHDHAHLHTMLEGVSNLTRVRAVVLLLENTAHLVQSLGGEGYQDWTVYLPFSAERMGHMASVLRGCFTGWTMSESVIYGESDEPGEEWRNTYVAINPDMSPLPDFRDNAESLQASAGVQNTRLIRNMHLGAVGWLEDSAEDYSERPPDYTEEDALRFDTLMQRLL